MTITWVKGVRIIWFSDRPAPRLPPTIGDGTMGQPRPEDEPAAV